jgi:hypothetical protein
MMEERDEEDLGEEDEGRMINTFKKVVNQGYALEKARGDADSKSSIKTNLTATATPSFKVTGIEGSYQLEAFINSTQNLARLGFMITTFRHGAIQ